MAIDQSELDGGTPEAGLSPEELEDEVVLDLPDREALSIVVPFGAAVPAPALAKGSVEMTQAVEQAAQ